MNFKDIKDVCFLGFPIAFALIAQLSMSLTDVILVTRLGEEEAAGISLALSLYSLVMVFCLGVIISLSPQYATEYAKEIINKEDFSKLFYNGFIISIIFSIIGCVFLFFTSDILMFLGYEGEIVEIASIYNISAIPGLLCFLLYINVRCFLNSVNKASITTSVMWLALPFNALFGYFLIFGFRGDVFLGVIGAGISSSIIRIFILFNILLIIYKNSFFNKIIIFNKNIIKPNKKIIKVSLIIGLPISFRLLFSEGFLPLISFFIGKLGDIQLVIHSVSLRIESVLAVFAIGFSGAITTFIAWAIEKKDIIFFKNKIMAVTLVIFLYIMFVSMILIFTRNLLAHEVFKFNDINVINLFNSIIYLICIYLFIDSAVTITNGILVGMSDTLYSMLSNLIGYWLITSIFIFFMITFYEKNIISIWIAICFGGLSVFIMNLLRIYYLTNKKLIK